MSENRNSLECTIVCWCVAAFVGVAAFFMLYLFGEFDGNQAVFSAGAVALVLGAVLSLFICRGQTAKADLAGEKPAERYAREAEAKLERRRAAAATPTVGDRAATAGSAPNPSHTETHGDSAPVHAAPLGADEDRPSQVVEGGVRPSKPLPGQAELASRKGAWTYQGDVGSEVDKSKAVPAGETAAPAVAPDTAGSDAGGAVDKSAAIPAGETAAPAVAPEGDGGTTEESKPKLYDSAPAEGADDLKMISGVGPKLEETLNDLGIYRFEQIAAWGPREVAWVDARIRFKGRIERDDWMSQARTLADGGETEFSKRRK